MFFSAIFTVWGLFFSAPAHADAHSYVVSLANAGYTGPVVKWLSMGYDICSLEAHGVPASLIASKIVVTTGEGIYSADAYEIIGITNAELCSDSGMAV